MAISKQYEPKPENPFRQSACMRRWQNLEGVSCNTTTEISYRFDDKVDDGSAWQQWETDAILLNPTLRGIGPPTNSHSPTDWSAASRADFKRHLRDGTWHHTILPEILRGLGLEHTFVEPTGLQATNP